MGGAWKMEFPKGRKGGHAYRSEASLTAKKKRGTIICETPLELTLNQAYYVWSRGHLADA